MNSQKSKNTTNSLKRIVVPVVFVLVFILLGKIDKTSSLPIFHDQEKCESNNFTAGTWIPTLAMNIVRSDLLKSTDQESSENLLCVEMETSLEDSQIFYILEQQEGKTLADEYRGDCVEITEGQWEFEAWAIHEENPHWRSNIIMEKFVVGEEEKKENEDTKKDENQKPTVEPVLQLDAPLSPLLPIEDQQPIIVQPEQEPTPAPETEAGAANGEESADPEDSSETITQKEEPADDLEKDILEE